METDIKKLAMAALQDATQPEKVAEIINDKIAATVKQAITDATRSYSNFGSDLEKKIAAALSLGDLDLPSYNAQVCAMVMSQVDTHVTDLVNGRLKSDIADMLSIAPKTIKLSEIVTWMTEPVEGEKYGEVVTCDLRDTLKERGDLWGPEWVLYLDEGEHYGHRNADTMADFKIEIWHGIKQDKSVRNDEITTGTIRTIYENGRALACHGKSSGGFTFSKTYGLAQRLLALYAAETVIDLDIEDVVISVGDY
jgi:hypothetical protein